MSKPNPLYEAVKGKAIGVNPNFAATFNWLVSFCNNMRGDSDAEGGKIVVDRSTDDYPVIRYERNSKAKTLASGDDSYVTFSQSDIEATTLKVDVYYV